jgi:hypothetical protein
MEVKRQRVGICGHGRGNFHESERRWKMGARLDADVPFHGPFTVPAEDLLAIIN